MKDGEKLAHAFILFHEPGPWDMRKINYWRAIMGHDEASTKALGDLARKIIEEARLAEQQQLMPVDLAG